MTRQEILAVAKPILFNTEMVRAILNGRKTVTRRIIKPQPIAEAPTYCYAGSHKQDIGYWHDKSGRRWNPPCHAGDYLYVRETWCALPVTPGGHMRGHDVYYYKADGDLRPEAWRRNWRPSIHMPKEAARIFLRVTAVLVERLQDITENGLHSEGVELEAFEVGYAFAEGIFHGVWDSTIKPADLLLHGWEANPWVWVIEFERMEAKRNG